MHASTVAIDKCDVPFQTNFTKCARPARLACEMSPTDTKLCSYSATTLIESLRYKQRCGECITLSFFCVFYLRDIATTTTTQTESSYTAFALAKHCATFFQLSNQLHNDDDFPIATACLVALWKTARILVIVFFTMECAMHLRCECRVIHSIEFALYNRFMGYSNITEQMT